MAQSPVPAPPRLSAIPISRHGLDNRGLEAGAIPGIGYGRFGRMFNFVARPIPDECLRDIADAMIVADEGAPIREAEPADENPTIPVGYTYFGQFIDHDISLDPTPLSTKGSDLAAMEDFRTPALDLDCLYGGGPDDQPYMYEEDGLRLRLGAPLTAAGAPHGANRDVLRLNTGTDKQPAILGDKRNDENRIVSQVQALFIAFHNKAVQDDALISAIGGDIDNTTSRFRAAAMAVRWHYQWVVANDYLPRICEPGMVAEVMGSGGPPRLENYDRPDMRYAYMPVEFAGAAYRFGHSMIRPGYALNADVGTTDERIPIFSRDRKSTSNLNGFGVPQPANWGIDWRFFLDGLGRDGLDSEFKVPQPSYRIDANLVDPLADLPEFHAIGSPFANLAYRNLARGANNLRLPSGEQVARALGIVPMSPDVIWGAGSRLVGAGAISPEFQANLDKAKARRKVVRDKWASGDHHTLTGNTPLWYYILREAEYYGVGDGGSDPAGVFGGHHLGPIGSRIVAETFIGLLWRDEMSYLRRWPAFKPLLPKAGPTFLLSDIVRYAL